MKVIMKEEKLTKKQIQDEAEKHIEYIANVTHELNDAFLDCLTEIEKEYGISVQHDLNNHMKTYMDSFGMIGGSYEIRAYDGGRHYASMFSGYDGEIKKSDEENIQDLEDASEIVKKTLEDAINRLGIDAKVLETNSFDTPIPKTSFIIDLREQPSQEVRDFIHARKEREFSKNIRKRRFW